MKITKRTTYSVSFDNDDISYETSFCPESGTLETRKLANGIAVLGYLVQDEDCPNPCEDQDGMGHIRSLNSRHINSIDRDEAVSLLESDNMVVPLSYFEHGSCRWGVEGSMSGMPDFNWDGTRFAGVWIPDKCCRDEILYRTTKRFLPEGCGVEYRSGASCLNVITPFTKDGPAFSDGRTFKNFTEAAVALAVSLGVEIDTEEFVKLERMSAVELAEECCKEYTAWANGDCHGVCVDCFDKDGKMIEDDACWGYIGWKYAQEERDRQIEYHVKKYETKETP